MIATLALALGVGMVIFGVDAPVRSPAPAPVDSVAVTYIRIRSVVVGGIVAELTDTLIVWEPLDEYRR